MKTTPKAAIFIDESEARLITGVNGFARFSGNLESDHQSHPCYRGEGSNQARFGTDPYHGSNNEYRMHRKEEEEKHQYFDRISDLLQPFDEILLFGPGEAKKELKNHLKELRAFKPKNIQIQNSDHQTDKQLLEIARAFLDFR